MNQHIIKKIHIKCIRMNQNRLKQQIHFLINIQYMIHQKKLII